METIIKIARQIRGYNLRDLSEKTKTGINILQYYECNKHTPRDEKIKILSNALNIDQDLLYFSFGLLPPKIKDKVRNLPTYYMEKIIEICNNDPSNSMKEEDIDFFNKSNVITYMKGPKSKEVQNETQS